MSGERGAIALRRFVLATAVLWTLAAGASLVWGTVTTRRALAGSPAAPADESAGDAGGGARSLRAAVLHYDQLVVAGHVAVWVCGLAFIGVGGRWLLRVDGEREEAERRLRCYAETLAQSNRANELFTDVLSHDLLNPAAASRYFVEQLRRGEADPRRLRFIDAVEHNLLRITEMVENASLYARLRDERGAAGNVADLGGLAREVLAELSPALQGAGITVSGPSSGSYPAVVHPMFANVVSNLVGNAVKYAAAGGRIAVEVESEGEAWVLSVRDWGPGIATAGKGSLFTRYERLGKQGVTGSGLGLAIARRIVELQAGAIWVEDNPEGGCVFRVRVGNAAAAGAPAGRCAPEAVPVVRSA